jgi:hypothetical protein
MSKLKDSPNVASPRLQKLAHRLLEEIVPIPLLRKIATIREMGAQDELIDLLLQKSNLEHSLTEIIAQLSDESFRQVYLYLDAELQRQIELIVTPPALLIPARRSRRESEIWLARHRIHRLKTEWIDTGKSRKRRTWPEVVKALHDEGVLPNKSKDQIYWALREKRKKTDLSLDDQKLLDEIFDRLERGHIKKEVERMADVIAVSRQRHTWEETQQILVEFMDWKGTLRQLMGAYARFRPSRARKQNNFESSAD